jgi:hypothetical protein
MSKEQVHEQIAKIFCEWSGYGWKRIQGTPLGVQLYQAVDKMFLDLNLSQLLNLIKLRVHK